MGVENELQDLGSLTAKLTQSDKFGDKLVAAGDIAFLGQSDPVTRAWVFDYLSGPQIPPKDYHPLFQLPLAFVKDPTAEELWVIGRYWNLRYAHDMGIICTVIEAAEPSLTENQKANYVSRAKDMYRKMDEPNYRGPLVKMIGKLREGAEEDWYCDILAKLARSLSWYNPEVDHAYDLAVRYDPHKAAMALVERIHAKDLSSSQLEWLITAILPLVPGLSRAKDIKEVTGCVTRFGRANKEGWENTLAISLASSLEQNQPQVIQLVAKAVLAGVDTTAMEAIFEKYRQMGMALRFR